jgi:bis(5'-adenosyl)-triphosphatase
MTKLAFFGLARILLVFPTHCFRLKPNSGWYSTPASELSFPLSLGKRLNMAGISSMSTKNDVTDNAPVKENEKFETFNGAGDKKETLMFGNFKIEPDHVFYKSPNGLTYALVNLRPLVPGHVLVVPTRVVPRMKNLTSEEYDDLWGSVRVIQEALECNFGASSSNVAIQDGVHAGQSVPHVHVHILPRRGDDHYNTEPNHNDQIYQDLQDWDPNSCILETLIKSKRSESLEQSSTATQSNHLAIPKVRMDRSFDEMKEEATLFHRVIQNYCKASVSEIS